MQHRKRAGKNARGTAGLEACATRSKPPGLRCLQDPEPRAQGRRVTIVAPHPPIASPARTNDTTSGCFANR